MANEYGHFTADGAEFVITTPHTPRPWINYLTNGDYCALCSHTGGGFSFYKDHKFNSVLRRGTFAHLEDVPGRLLYLKDEATGEFWTANGHPVGKCDRFEARHGMGYTRIESSYSGVKASVRYFVPMGTDAEMWSVQLTNEGGEPRTLSLYSLADFVLGNVFLEENESQIISLFNEATIRQREIILQKTWWHDHPGWHEEMGDWPYRVFVTASRKPQAAMTNRDAFFGAFRSYHNPAALEPPVLPSASPSGKGLVAAMQWRVTLQPGETWGVHIAVGVQANSHSAANRRQLLSLQKAETYEKAWKDTLEHWRKLFAGVRVQTPDANINGMVNFWNKYQLMVNFHFGRGPSYFHKGQRPAMRDSCQDAFGVIPLAPELARKNLLRIAHFFFKDGRPSGGCNRIGQPERPSVKVDLPLWFVLAVTDYLRETGDFAFLDTSVPFVDGGESTIYQKMTKGIDRMLDQRGRHGLPLIGHGDWNDAANTIGAKGKGESVWLAQFLYFALQEISALLQRRREHKRLARYQQRATQIRKSVNQHCWDGKWFVRAFRDDGRPVGVRGQKEGMIWINSQTWAVIAGIADDGRLNQCIDSVEKHLSTPYGLMNLVPAFTAPDDSIGLITRFRAGWKENAAVFSHASSFNVVARAMLGRGNDAVDLFRRLLPGTKDADKYLMEPYVYAQFCAGPGAGDDLGQGAYHWLTGTAAWMFRAMTDYIMGVHPTFAGLRISPAVDATWREFKMTRTFRGCAYEFDFSNPERVESGIAGLWLDGRPVAGNVLPLPTRKRHHVRVLMGRSTAACAAKRS